MRRSITVSLVMVVMLLPALVMAQETPPLGEQTEPPIEETKPLGEETTAQPVPTDPATLALIDARLDLENLANNQLGTRRPIGWTNNGDGNDPSLIVDVRLDLELLANALVGINERPQAWFGASRSTRDLGVRDIRHDLEVLADNTLQANVRPPGWIGGDAMLRCDRATQNLVNLLEQGGVFTLAIDANRSDFCRAAADQASLFVESTLLGNTGGSGGPTTTAPTASSGQGGGAPIVTGRSIGGVRPNAGVAVAFLDRYARTRVGVIPEDVRMNAVARSFTQFSNMTVMQGGGFEVFVDYTYTTLTDAQFALLPDVNNFNVETTCEAAWCTAPAPHRGAPAFVAGQGGGGFSGLSGQNLVTLDNIVIFYDGGDSDGTTLVRMQLCPQNTQGGNMTQNCQPVTQVVGGNGAPIPPVGSAGGLPQFRLPYGFNTSSARSANFYTADLWIAFPDQR